MAHARTLCGEEREWAKQIIISEHYSHGFPSGKSHVFSYGMAIVVLSIPANKNIGPFLFSVSDPVWELTRLWAPDRHRPNLLTEAIKFSLIKFRKIEPTVVGLVSYADPNVGHEGGVYKAASWVFTGQSEEGRYYVKDGQVVSRRAFHSGKTNLTKAQILARGYSELKRPGKLRFAKGLRKSTRRNLTRKFEGTH